MWTNVQEYDDINRLTFHKKESLILCPLAQTAYLTIVRIISTKSFNFLSNVKIQKQESEKRFKIECYVHPFRTVFN